MTECFFFFFGATYTPPILHIDIDKFIQAFLSLLITIVYSLFLWYNIMYICYIYFSLKILFQFEQTISIQCRFVGFSTQKANLIFVNLIAAFFSKSCPDFHNNFLYSELTEFFLYFYKSILTSYINQTDSIFTKYTVRFM